MRRVRALVCSALLSAACAAAQTSQIDELENEVLAHPSRADTRIRILQLAGDPRIAAAIPYDRLIETRRRHILWLIENHPEAPDNFQAATRLVPPSGSWADPEGYAESLRLWKKIVASPGVSARVVADAAIYLKATDRTEARSMLDAALARQPDDKSLWHAVGIVDAAAVAGLNGDIVSMGGPGQFRTDPALRDSAPARAARQEIESSQNPWLLGGAGATVGGAILIENQAQIRFGDDDMPALAERWTRRAVAIDPTIEQLRSQLTSILRARANGSDDPRERARLFSEILSLAREADRPRLLPELAKAEFEAGADEAAGRDAQRALDSLPEIPGRNANLAAELINRANSVLGRIALARGDLSQAKARLRASLAVPSDATAFRFNGPDLSLAEDLADAGESDAVTEFLEASRAFWLYDRGQIDRIIKLVRSGRKRAAFASPVPASDLLNRSAPPFTLHDLAGNEWTLASIQGKRSALYFWNTGCKICPSQIEDLAKSAGDVRILAVNIGDDETAIQAFVEKNSVAATVLAGATRVMASAYRADSIPSIVVLDARGRVVQFQAGASANPRQALEQISSASLAAPVAIGSGADGRLSWRPVAGAQSYVVEWEEKDQRGWPSDRDGFVRVIPTRDTQAQLDSTLCFRWRIYAVSVGSRSEPTGWIVANR